MKRFILWCRRIGIVQLLSAESTAHDREYVCRFIDNYGYGHHDVTAIYICPLFMFAAFQLLEHDVHGGVVLINKGTSMVDIKKSWSFSFLYEKPRATWVDREGL